MAKIDIILSSINNIFKKINLLNNIDKYIINKEMTGGMISNNNYGDGYGVDYDGDSNVDYDNGDDVVDYDVSNYGDGDYDSDHDKLMHSILLNKDLIDQLSELINKLNKYPNDTNIVKLIKHYNIIINELEYYQTEYAKMAAYLFRDNINTKTRRINDLKTDVNTTITKIIKDTPQNLLLDIKSTPYNPGTKIPSLLHDKTFIPPGSIQRIHNKL